MALLCVLTLFARSALTASDTNTTTDPSLDQLKKLSIEELLDIPLVYGASRHSQKITEAPSSISIITADDIRKFGYRTLADILRGVQGFYINYDRAYGYIGVRGFNKPGDFGGRVLVLVDGHRINDPLYDSAPVVDDFTVDMDLIERVEVIRGPSFSLYGANAFFGGINVITRQGKSVNGVEVAGRAASQSSFQGRAAAGKQFANGLEVLLSGSKYSSGGVGKLYYPEFDQPRNNNGISENHDGADADRAFVSASFKDFKLRGAFLRRAKDIPTAPYADSTTSFNEPGTRYLDQRVYLNLTYAHEYGSGLDVKAKLYYDSYNFQGDYALRATSTAPRQLIRNPTASEWWGAEMLFSKEMFKRHRTMLGVEYKDVFRSMQKSLDITNDVLLADIVGGWRSWSFYLQDEYRITDDLILNAGLRYDNYSSFGDTANPRFALIYNPLPKTTLKLLYGEAFRAPNDYERTFTWSIYKANPALKPETIRTVEFIWDQYINNTFKFNISGYRNEVRDLITQVQLTDGSWLFDNVANAHTWGADIEFEAKSVSGWRGQLSYSWQNTIDEQSRTTLTNSPEHLVKFNLVAPLYSDSLFAGLQVQYTSGALTLKNQTTGGYWLTNLNLFSQKLVPGMDLSAGVFNLFDHRYTLPGRGEYAQDAIQQDGRTFQIILRQRF